MLRKKKSIRLHRFTVFAVILTTVIICGLLIGRSRMLKARAENYQTQLTELKKEKEELTKEKKELKEYRKYMASDKYIEDTARQKLGLVYPGEIVFEPEDSTE